MSELWPNELRVSDKGRLFTISFETGERFEFPAEFLRVESPSAEVKGHRSDQAVTVPGKKTVRIRRLEPVGNYAVRIVFDDGHDTGLYSWEYLGRLGRDQDRLWADYLGRLAEKGLSR